MTIDSSHSEVGFKVKHLMISTVKGNFGTFGGSIEGNTDNMDINVRINVDSVNTNNADRDGHLKSGDFFDAEQYPEIVFHATGVNLGSSEVTGNLTIKGITKEVTLGLTYNGESKDPWGNLKHGFEISGKVNRADFGLVWNAPLETGGVLVSENVDLMIDVQCLETAE